MDTNIAVEPIQLTKQTRMIYIDLDGPRVIIIRGLDPRSGETKEYFLKVTGRGGLVLV